MGSSVPVKPGSKRQRPHHVAGCFLKESCCLRSRLSSSLQLASMSKALLRKVTFRLSIGNSAARRHVPCAGPVLPRTSSKGCFECRGRSLQTAAMSGGGCTGGCCCSQVRSARRSTSQGPGRHCEAAKELITCSGFLHYTTHLEAGGGGGDA